MKKLLALLLCLLMCLCFVSCTEDTNTGETDNNDNNVIEDGSGKTNTAIIPEQSLSDWMSGKNLQFRVRSCTFTDKYDAVNPEYQNVWFEIDSVDKTYVYFLVEAKNISTEYPVSLASYSNQPIKFSINGEERYMLLIMENNNEGFTSNEYLDVGESGYAHYYYPIEKTKIVNGGVVKGKLDGVEFEFTIK